MANILISSLGIGHKKDGGYQKAIYQLSKDKIETTFISKALSQMLKIDKLFLIGTKGSIWDSCYSEFGGNDENIELKLYEKIEKKELSENDLKIVNETIDKALGVKGSKCFIIEYGLNEEELWKNFSQYIDILEHIKDGDIVYIDISHAFRSLALMSFLMIQFGHIIKNKKFKIGGIFYGMLEVARENDGITPIVDLKIFYDLMEWIKAVNAFKNYGHADLLVQMFEKEKNIKSQTKDTFNLFDINLSMANMSALEKFIQNAKRVLPVLQSSTNHIVRLISPDIIAFIKRMDQNTTSKFQYELAKWFFENKNYALSYIVLLEALISFECEKNVFDIQDKKDREKAKEILYSGENKSCKICKIYKKISKIRNDIAHQRKSTSNIIKDVQKLEKYINDISLYIKGKL